MGLNSSITSQENGFTQILLTSVFSSSLTSLSPLLLSSSLAFLSMSFLLSYMPSKSSLSQLRGNLSSCMALYSLNKVLFFLGQCTSVLQHHFSGDFPHTFLGHESSHFELIPQSSEFFPCDPLLCRSIFQFLASLAGILPSARI